MSRWTTKWSVFQYLDLKRQETTSVTIYLSIKRIGVRGRSSTCDLLFYGWVESLLKLPCLSRSSCQSLFRTLANYFYYICDRGWLASVRTQSFTFWLLHYRRTLTLLVGIAICALEQSSKEKHNPKFLSVSMWTFGFHLEERISGCMFWWGRTCVCARLRCIISLVNELYLKLKLTDWGYYMTRL